MPFDDSDDSDCPISEWSAKTQGERAHTPVPGQASRGTQGIARTHVQSGTLAGGAPASIGGAPGVPSTHTLPSAASAAGKHLPAAAAVNRAHKCRQLIAATRFGAHCAVGDRIMACDEDMKWAAAKVMGCARDDAGACARLRVRFVGFELADEWIRVGGSPSRLRPFLDERTGLAIKGTRVQIQWDEGVWYAGKVVGFAAGTQQHRVLFDDGDAQWYYSARRPHASAHHGARI